MLEIGGGWGSFALHAAGRYGCHVTTTTVSRAQFEVATARVAAAGLTDRVTVLQRDYRDVHGTFDRLVSIEMIEAVGARYLPRYFAACAARLAPGGQMLLQGIVLPEYRYRATCGRPTSSSATCFPGGALTSLGAIAAAIGAAPTSACCTSRTSRRTTSARCACGARPFSTAATTPAAWATTSASSASGSSTWPTARPASPSTAPAWCRCC